MARSDGYHEIMQLNHPTKMTMWPGPAAVPVFLFGLLVVGCSDPKFQAEQSGRDQRIHHYTQSYLRRESESPAHLQALEDERKMLGVRRDEQLKDRLIAVKRQEQTRAETLRETRPVRHERVHSILRGKPETMRDTWADMFY